MHSLTLHGLATLIISLSDPVPEDHEVKAGWVAFGLFIGMILAVALLGRSLFTRLRKAQQAEEAGVYAPSGRTRAREAANAEADSAATTDGQPAEEPTVDPGGEQQEQDRTD